MKWRRKNLYVAALAGFLAGQLVFGQGMPAAHDAFNNVKMVIQNGDKSGATEVTLSLEADRLVVQPKRGGDALKAFPYPDIKAADYSFSKHPRWRSGIVVAAAVGVFALPVFFMKGKKHWLTVRTERDSAVFRLNKNNYEQILRAFEVRSGQKVQRMGEAKAKAKV
jgi:hypothetical protein